MQLRKQLAYRDGYITTPYQVSLSKSSVNWHKEMQGFLGGWAVLGLHFCTQVSRGRS